MTYPGVIYCLAMSLSLLGCIDEKNGSEDTSHKSFADFEKYVTSSSGNDSVNCGTVGIGMSVLDTNTCVVESFVNHTSFQAIYRWQGTDSSIASAITMSSNGVILLWRFDGSIDGSPNGPSLIVKTECLDPQLTGTVDDVYAQLFNCGP